MVPIDFEVFNAGCHFGEICVHKMGGVKQLFPENSVQNDYTNYAGSNYRPDW
jgi:hypothetical protein